MSSKNTNISDIIERIYTGGKVPAFIGTCINKNKTTKEFIVSLLPEHVADHTASDLEPIALSESDIRRLAENRCYIYNIYDWEGQGYIYRDYHLMFYQTLNKMREKMSIGGPVSHRRSIQQTSFQESAKLSIKDGISLTVGISVMLSAHGMELHVNAGLCNGNESLYLFDSIIEMPDDKELKTMLPSILYMACAKDAIAKRIQDFKNPEK